LARGHAIACGRKQISDADIAIILKVALSSAPIERVKFLNLLIDKGGELIIDDIVEEISISRKSAKRLVAIFEHLGIVNCEFIQITNGGTKKFIKLDSQFLWFIGKRFKELKLHCRHTGSK
jgi:predicted transcriptional regulator